MKSNKTKNQKSLQPRLRFPEFRGDGDWEKKKLEEICDYSNGLSHENSVTEKGDYYLISLNSIDINGKLKPDMKRLSNTDNSLQKDDLIMVLSDVAHGNFLGLVDIIPNDRFVLNQRMARLRIKESDLADVRFLRTFINSNQKYFKANGQGSSQLNLSKSSVTDFAVLFPLISEQQKIADCLSSLDELIEAEDQKLEALQRHKKGLMQELFPSEGQTLPKRRFPEFHSAPEWKPKKIGDEDFASLHKGKGISKADISIDGKIPCIRYGELYTRYGEVIYEVSSKTNCLTSSLFLSKKNDVIIPSSGETKIDIATASCVTLASVALGSDLNVIRSHHNGIFISYYLNGSLKKEISKVSQGDSVVHLYLSQLAKLEIFLPESEEQQRIADFLSSIDDLIVVQTKKLKSLRLHKKGLMQQLFPNTSEVPE